MNEDNEILITLVIPNEEIRLIYKNTILNWFDEGIKSNRKKQYGAELLEEGYTNIVKYGITFYKKDCMIKRY